MEQLEERVSGHEYQLNAQHHQRKIPKVEPAQRSL
jgi:hypothetical protein